VTATTRSVERYVSGRMDEQEERQFEELILTQPEIAAEVDAHQRIKAGLERLEQRGELQELLGRPVQPNYLKYALAASVLIALVLIASFWRSSSISTGPMLATSLQELYGQEADRAVSGTYLLASNRSRGDETTINVARGTGALRLQVVPEVAEATSFSVSLVRVSGNSETTLAQSLLSRDANRGMVEIFIDADTLGSGEYRLTLASQGVAPATTHSYAFVLNLD
jgi:hypothetical protein